jgi:hypothetical protein
MRKVLVAVAVLAAMVCVANTAAAAVGTPASLAANVAATAVGHRPVVVARVVTPVYRPRVFVPAPVVVPAPVIVPRAVYYGPRFYRPILGAPVYLDAPYVSSYGIVY